MKVILLENLKRIGTIGETIDVKRGFARNFLIANKKALYASKENIKEVQKIKNELSKKDNEKKQDAKKVAEKVNKKEYSVKKLSTENNELYGSVKPTEISKLLKEKITIHGAGRLDVGVHAKEQSAHFDCKNKIVKLDRFLKND